MTFQQEQKGFTLIELLVVLGLIAILAAILIVVINPARIFQRARDTQRIGDLRNLDSALSGYLAELSSNPGNIQMDNTANNTRCVNGSASTTIFYSNVVNDPISPNLSGGEGAGGDTFVWANGTTSRAVNGTGWLPVNLATATVLQLSVLPIDPINSAVTSTPSYYYTYACKTDYTYELNANLETNTNAEQNQNDGGDNPYLYEVGTNKKLLPTATAPLFYPGAQ